VITSASLGGGALTPEELSEVLSRADKKRIAQLLKRGVCIPLFFPGDCAFDNAIVVVGDLTDREESEWIGRIRSKLSVPCGKLLITCGGGDDQELKAAMSGKGYPDYRDYFKQIAVPPGDYLAEVYAFVSSMTVDFYFEEGEPLEEWFRRTRPGQDLPLWLQYFNQGRAIGELGDDLVSYILRLSPLASEPELPRLVDEIGWCGEFDFRRPDLCPLGIPRSALRW
jgi:hypothetical protein